MKTILLLEDLPEIRAWLRKLVLQVFPGSTISEAARVQDALALVAAVKQAMGLDRERDTYITNLVKCRPPGDRPPEGEEIHQCSPFLKEQIRLVGPRLIVALGSGAAAALLSTGERLTSLRGKLQPLAWAPEILVMPTFHPAYLLRDPHKKREVWEDMKMVRDYLKVKSEK